MKLDVGISTGGCLSAISVHSDLCDSTSASRYARKYIIFERISHERGFYNSYYISSLT